MLGTNGGSAPDLGVLTASTAESSPTTSSSTCSDMDTVLEQVSPDLTITVYEGRDRETVCEMKMECHLG